VKRDIREATIICRLEESFVHTFFPIFLGVGRKELKPVKLYVICHEVILQAKLQLISALHLYNTMDDVLFIKDMCTEKKQKT